MPDLITQIKKHYPLLPFAGQYLPNLRKAGTDYVSECCFHREKTGSLVIHPRSSRYPDTYKCFGCSAGGDVIDFYAAVEGISKGQSIHRLAEQAGISEDGEPVTREQRLYLQDLQRQSEYWWKQRRARVLSIFEATTTEYFDQSAMYAPDDVMIRLNDLCHHYGQIIRWIDSMPAKDKTDFFLHERTGADLKAWRFHRGWEEEFSKDFVALSADKAWEAIQQIGILHAALTKIYSVPHTIQLSRKAAA